MTLLKLRKHNKKITEFRTELKYFQKSIVNEL